MLCGCGLPFRERYPTLAGRAAARSAQHKQYESSQWAAAASSSSSSSNNINKGQEEGWSVTLHDICRSHASPHISSPSPPKKNYSMQAIDSAARGVRPQSSAERVSPDCRSRLAARGGNDYPFRAHHLSVGCGVLRGSRHGWCSVVWCGGSGQGRTRAVKEDNRRRWCDSGRRAGWMDGLMWMPVCTEIQCWELPRMFRVLAGVMAM